MKPKTLPTKDVLSNLLDAVEEDCHRVAHELAFKIMKTAIEAAEKGNAAVSVFNINQRTTTVTGCIILKMVKALEIVLRRIDPEYKHNKIKSDLSKIISSFADVVETKEQQDACDKVMEQMKASGGKVGSC